MAAFKVADPTAGVNQLNHEMILEPGKMNLDSMTMTAACAVGHPWNVLKEANI